MIIMKEWNPSVVLRRSSAGLASHVKVFGQADVAGERAPSRYFFVNNATAFLSRELKPPDRPLTA
jgi:hypothetical protein